MSTRIVNDSTDLAKAILSRGNLETRFENDSALQDADSVRLDNFEVQYDLDTVATGARVVANATAVTIESVTRLTSDGNLSTRITSDSALLRTIVGNFDSRIVGDSSRFETHIDLDNDTSSSNETNTIFQVNGANLEITDASGTLQVPLNIINTEGVFETIGDSLVRDTGGYDVHDFVIGSPQLDDSGNALHDSRMFFDKSKGAFRAGSVTFLEWDNVNIGVNSVAFGNANTASGVESTVGGGSNNIADTIAATVGGGSANTGSGMGSTIGGGSENTASGLGSAIGGGSENTGSGIGSTIGGGSENTASGIGSNTGGGQRDTASADFSTVSGGSDNIASGMGSTIGGGLANTASGIESTIAGGYDNTASGSNSAVLGGINNTAQSYGEIVLGTYSAPLASGFDALNYVSTDRLFVVGDGTASGAKSNALVMLKNGTTFLNGQLNLSDGIDTLTYPNADGVANEVLKTDGSGNLSFATVSSLTVDTAWNYKAYDNIQLNGNFLSNDGDNEGLSVNEGGEVSFSTNTGTAFIFTKSSESLLMEMLSHGSGPNAGTIFDLHNARGTAASPTNVVDGDRLFVIKSRAYEGFSKVRNELMKINVDGAVSLGIVPTRTEFNVAKDDGADSTVLTLRSSGNVGVGDLNPDSSLTVNGGIMARAIRLTDGAGVGKILTSVDVNGKSTWSAVSAVFTTDTLSVIQSTDRSRFVRVDAVGEIGFGINGSKRFSVLENRLEFTEKTVFIGTNAGNAQFFSSVIPDGEANVAIGYDALKTNGTSTAEVAIGPQALMNSGSSAGGNTAIGAQALKLNDNGGGGTAVGHFSLSNVSSGSNNTALGSSSLLNLTSGVTNTAFGHSAGSGLTIGGDNVFIGPNTGSVGSYSSRLYLDNAGGGSTPIIYGDLAEDSLVINGVLTIDSLKNGSGYTFPGKDGTADQVMVTDGLGNVNWSAVPIDACPVGMAAAGTSMCIETAERGAATWFNAAITCTFLGYKLPTWAEWFSGVSIGGATLTDTTNDWEWVDGGTANTARKVGKGGLINTANDSPTNAVDVTYRCVTYK